uniref:Uncharacterized protein n=1 Tax=Nelumbo nucifera TaxID=4432 RepID=A0A822ZSQ2_NELNU|nr:TPA_asm: hypothetical protein HUJ06_004186 [Nelumbo nucifera]
MFFYSSFFSLFCPFSSSLNHLVQRKIKKNLQDKYFACRTKMVVSCTASKSGRKPM